MKLRQYLIEQDIDEIDIKKLVKDLKKYGKEYDESGIDSYGIGGEKFSYKTRNIYTEIRFILDDRPDLVKYVTPEYHKYFESFLFNGKKIDKLYKMRKKL